jgi:homogentisate phytyltransferase/homogentisate geranylgeranyltransferase
MLKTNQDADSTQYFPKENKFKSKFKSFWNFSRPHTIIGTTLSVFALCIMAVTRAAPITWDLPRILVNIFLALIPSLCANVYIVGLNQLTDIEIDRINKPNLPLASGDFSEIEGRWIVILLGVAGLLLAASQGNILFGTVALSMAIGTAYSLPPLRLKRFPFWAALCIFGVRGMVVNLGFYSHFQQLFSPISTSVTLFAWESIPSEVWALTAFVILFAFAIAIFKDIPDIDGDRQFQIRTLTVRLGSEFVFWLSQWVLTLCYGLLIILALIGFLPSLQPMFVVSTHLGLLGLMWLIGFRVNLEDKSQISQYYQFIWKLFFLEYLLFPIACLIA